MKENSYKSKMAYIGTSSKSRNYRASNLNQPISCKKRNSFLLNPFNICKQNARKTPFIHQNRIQKKNRERVFSYINIFTFQFLTYIKNKKKMTNVNP